MPAGVTHYPDPCIEYGPFRVLPRTDGGYVVVDMRRRLGNKTIGKKFRTCKDADFAARMWHLQGHGKGYEP